VVVKYRVPVGLPTGGKKYPSCTRLGSGRVWVPPTGKKSSAYPYPSGQVPGGYRLSVPELPSLIGGVRLGNGGDALATGDDGDAGDDDVLSAMRHVGIGIVAEVRDVCLRTTPTPA
jgi:hypothetical protein